jgi:hypothetical protein
MSTNPLPASFASLLQDFFCKRLIVERNLSTDFRGRISDSLL